MKKYLLIALIVMSACRSGGTIRTIEDDTEAPDLESALQGTQEAEALNPAPLPEHERETGRIDGFIRDIVPQSDARFSNTGLRTYRSVQFAFSALISPSWNITAETNDTEGTWTLRSDEACISVQTRPLNQESAEQFHKNTQNEFANSVASSKIFIENRSIIYPDGQKGLLFVAEQTRGEGSDKYLLRVLTITAGQVAYIIVCEAPLRSFYDYENNFNAFMSSFRTL